MLNDLHPNNMPRRLRRENLRIDHEDATCMPRLIRTLRDQADHLDDLAEIWEAPGRPDEVTENALHLTNHYRRTARRLRDTASAIERDHAAGPWINLDQPFVHLTEACQASQEAH